MKIKTSPKITAACALLLVTQLAGYSQTYVLPGQSLPPFGPAILLSGSLVGSLSWGSATLSDTVAINPSAYTIEQSGSISLAAATSTFSVTQTQQVISVVQDFPNPQMTVTNSVPGTLTMSMNFAGGTFSFDTGAQTLTWNGSLYTYNGQTPVQIPVDISYSLVTGGQTYAGTYDDVGLFYDLTLSDQLGVGNYPNSISLSPSPSWFALPNYSSRTIADFTAADGFQANIISTAPEPSAMALLACGLLALTFLKRQKSF
jgi:hypothetical protein